MICPTPVIDAAFELYSNRSRTKRDTSIQEEGRLDEYYDDSDGQTLFRSKREVTTILRDKQFRLGFLLDAVEEYIDLLLSHIREQAYVDIIYDGPSITSWGDTPKRASHGSITIEVWIATWDLFVKKAK